jgi:hypothetical protein
LVLIAGSGESVRATGNDSRSNKQSTWAANRSGQLAGEFLVGLDAEFQEAG